VYSLLKIRRPRGSAGCSTANKNRNKTDADTYEYDYYYYDDYYLPLTMCLGGRATRWSE
jgi:hypothetical protein